MAIEPVVEGWTNPIDFPLKAAGVAVDLTGATVTMILKDKSGTAVTVAGTVTVPTPANGTVRFTPAATDLLAAKSPHSLRFKVTLNGVAFFPNAAAEEWVVYRP